MLYRLQIPFLLCCWIGLSTNAHACSVPVFRYAVEHWPPDVYEALVLHRGKLSETDKAVTDHLLARSPKNPRPNLTVQISDLDLPDSAPARQLWENLGSPSLPRLIVRPNPRAGLTWLNLSLPLTQESAELLENSPARTEIVKRIANEDSVVWVLLESGNKTADADAMKVLNARLAYLLSVLKLPELSAADIANGLVSVGADGLKLRFSSLSVSRTDPKESIFVQTLLGLESDLKDIDEPMVFPVFGQGRALMPMVGKGINNSMIDAAAIFLVGKCSCEVKDENPGADLLITANWVEMVKRQAAGALMAAAKPETNSPPAQLVPELVTFSGDTKPDTPPPVTGTPSRFQIAIPLCALLLGGILIMLRKHTSNP
ncbi:MAG: hypothetical protein ISQ14_01990 [Verrucomicrobiae bacterium]|nr:hypothetical protein [Verrucomicrobiae bacterium]